MEIGLVKPKEVLVDWDEAKIKATNFNRRERDHSSTLTETVKEA